jgi:lipopolysaccharide export system protein LptA
MNRTVLLLFFSVLASYASAEKITFSANAMTGKAGSTADVTTLSGNAFVKTSSMEITADLIEMKGENFRYIIATGSVTGKNTGSQMDFTCSKMKYDRETKIAQLEGMVHLVDQQNNVSADAEIIEYNQNSETAVMQINVSLKQKNNVCTSAFAVYRKNMQLLEMSGNPKIVQGEDTFRAQEITLNMTTQQITLDGRVSGTVNDSTPPADNTASSPEAPPHE